MSAQNSTTKTTTDATVIPPEAYEAFANFLRAGNTGSFNEWIVSDAGKAAVSAVADQQKAKVRAALMADAKAIWRDFKADGSITTDNGKRAAARLLAHLQSADLTVTVKA